MVWAYGRSDAGSFPYVSAAATPQRHGLIFSTFAALRPGQGFILVNDHDPKPLYYQLKFERDGQFTLEYQAEGPGVWRVRIGKPG